MSSEKSNIGGGGTRYTEHVKSHDFLGNDTSYVNTRDYDASGQFIGGVHTDHNGNQWNVNTAGSTTHKIGNDGRND
jgi:hypothetical protein